MTYLVVIPARYASTRLPGKPLLDIAGKSLLQRVYEQACQSAANRVVIATDDLRVKHAADAFQAEVCMTSENHSSGTERIAEVVEILGLDEHQVIVNVQGDEPMLPPSLIDLTAKSLLEKQAADMATLCFPIGDTTELINPNVVKVVFDNDGYALYFSRAPIPWDREGFNRNILCPDNQQTVELEQGVFFRHIGIYAYRASFITDYVKTSSSKLEQLEKLEQLRAMENGHRIAVSVVDIDPGQGVDTAEDLENVRQLLQ